MDPSWSWSMTRVMRSEFRATIISSMILGAAWFAGLDDAVKGSGMNAVILPLVIAIIGVVASFLGFFLVRTKEGGDPQQFGRGDLITFPAGLTCTWDIAEAVEKHYDFA